MEMRGSDFAPTHRFNITKNQGDRFLNHPLVIILYLVNFKGLYTPIQETFYSLVMKIITKFAWDMLEVFIILFLAGN